MTAGRPGAATPDGAAQFHRREQAAQQQRTADHATQQELAERSRNRWIASGEEGWVAAEAPYRWSLNQASPHGPPLHFGAEPA